MIKQLDVTKSIVIINVILLKDFLGFIRVCSFYIRLTNKACALKREKGTHDVEIIPKNEPRYLTSATF